MRPSQVEPVLLRGRVERCFSIRDLGESFPIEETLFLALLQQGKKLSINQICILVGLSIPLLKKPNLDYFVCLGDLKI